jgi:large subunit ribosomal protein L25
MDRLKLSADNRKVLGKKVKKLRKEGILPGNLFGKKIKSISLQLPTAEFEKIYKEAGETGLIDLKVGEESHPVLIHNVHVNPVTGASLHVDFHIVSLTEKTTAQVPVEITGEAPAVTQGLGILIQPISEFEVEALPQDFPEHILVDISKLEAVDQSITVADLKLDSKITLKVDPTEIVVKIGPLEKEEEAPVAPAEGEVPAEGSAEQTSEGGEVPAEGSAEQTSEAPVSEEQHAEEKKE